jgi:hypothetical protein
MKSRALLYLIAFLSALALSKTYPTSFIGSVHSTHNAQACWIGDVNGILINDTLMAFKGPLTGFNATFALTNSISSPDSITNVTAVIARSPTTGTLFHFAAGCVYYQDFISAVPNWLVETAEPDSKGWPSVVKFKALPESNPTIPLPLGETFWFRMTFTEGPVSCNRPDAFSIYSKDIGSSSGTPETELSGTLGITVDNSPPATTTVPADDEAAFGTYVPPAKRVGPRYYFNLSVTANDAVPDNTSGVIHDTGIYAVNITIDNGDHFRFYNECLGIAPGQTWALPSANNTVWNLTEGTHILKVTAWDNVGNAAVKNSNFLYMNNHENLSISNFNTSFANQFVRVTYPSDNPLKPLSRHWASTSDWTASAFLTTKLTNSTEGFDTDSNFVNQTSGKPIGAQGTGIVSFGGPIVNVPVYYYEVNKVAPVLHVDTPGARGAGEPWSLWYYQNGTSITATAAGIDEHNDYFLIEVFKDSNGRNVLFAYGIGGKGTYAAGKYFHYTMYPNIQSYNVGWIIVKWEDTNMDGFVNGPDDGDTYTSIASG